MQISYCSLTIILKHNAINGCKYTTFFMNTNKKKEKKLDFYFMRLEIPQFSCTFARNKAENYFIMT